MASGSSNLDLKQWGDPKWRLSNLYYIQDEAGFKVKFVPNEAQLDLLDNYWYLNVILKARQRGFTTLIDLMALDQCVFNDDFSAGIIAHNMEDAQKIFRRKVRFPFDHLPEGLRSARELTKDTETQLAFDNGSDIGVGVSMRSGTMQFLHISEFGKICAKYPDKAREIVTGSFNAVHAGQFIFVESTAEGRGGYFFDICETAKKNKLAKKALSKLDFRFHFYPWHEDERYRLDPKGVQIPEKARKYFLELERKHRIKLDAAQRAWYVRKAELMGDDMKREYPSVPEEAFEVALKGAYYQEEMQRARIAGRICKIPYLRNVPVDTFWDLGLSKNSGTTAIWCGQYASMQHRFLKCHEAHGQSLDYYMKWLLDTGFAFGRHFLPHDAGVRRLGKHSVKSWKQLLEELMPGHTFVLVKRIEDIAIGIAQTKALFDAACFDEEGCADGIKALDNYQREWDEDDAVFANHPLHNWASNYADAFRQWGQGWTSARGGPPVKTESFTPLDKGMGY